MRAWLIRCDFDSIILRVCEINVVKKTEKYVTYTEINGAVLEYKIKIKSLTHKVVFTKDDLDSDVLYLSLTIRSKIRSAEAFLKEAEDLVSKVRLEEENE